MMRLAYLPSTGRSFGRFLIVAALGALAFSAVTLFPGQLPVASAQETPDCGAVAQLGNLTDADGGALEAAGRWTADDCDSLFLPDSGAQTYRFELSEPARVHIDLRSAVGDSYLHLLTADGDRIAHDDDSGVGINAAIEYQLAAGAYIIEAAQAAGRDRGPADFTLTVAIETGCDPIDLGVLEESAPLVVEGRWTHGDCGSRFRQTTPAVNYRFTVMEEAHVRIDLIAPDSDPYMYLLDSDERLLYSDDDGGSFRDSRIVNDLAPGDYIVEASTWFDRENVLIEADFTLSVAIISEDRAYLKVEDIVIPDVVIAGDEFEINYRVGNLGNLDLEEGAVVGIVAYTSSYTVDRLRPVFAGEHQWYARTSYHSSDVTAIPSSAAIDEIRPFTGRIYRPGKGWVFVAAYADTAEGEELTYERIWREIMVVSGPTYGPVTVLVDGDRFTVAAEADENGVVTPRAEPSRAGSEDSDKAKAIFAAGFSTQVFDGIMERPAIAALDFPLAGEALDPPLELSDPSSGALLAAFGQHYAAALDASGLVDAAGAGLAPLPSQIDALTLGMARTAWREYIGIRNSWNALAQEYEGGAAPAFDEMFEAYTQQMYAELVAAPLVAGGRAVASGEAELTGLTEHSSCAAGALLAAALTAIGYEDVAAAVALDADLRAASTVYGAMVDAALCAAAGADSHSAWLVERLGVEDTVVEELVFPPASRIAPPQEPPSPVSFRIVARMVADGRVELGVEFENGLAALPARRFLPANGGSGWALSSSIVTAAGDIGVIRARRLADGRVELGFRDADGATLTPAVRFLPSNAPQGVWVRSSLLTAVPAGAAQLEE